MSNKGDVICFSHKKQVPILSVSIKKDSKINCVIANLRGILKWFETVINFYHKFLLFPFI